MVGLKEVYFLVSVFLIAMISGIIVFLNTGITGPVFLAPDSCESIEISEIGGILESESSEGSESCYAFNEEISWDGTQDTGQEQVYQGHEINLGAGDRLRINFLEEQYEIGVVSASEKNAMIFLDWAGGFVIHESESRSFALNNAGGDSFVISMGEIKESGAEIKVGVSEQQAFNVWSRNSPEETSTSLILVSTFFGMIGVITLLYLVIRPWRKKKLTEKFMSNTEADAGEKSGEFSSQEKGKILTPRERIMRRQSRLSTSPAQGSSGNPDFGMK